MGNGVIRRVSEENEEKYKRKFIFRILSGGNQNACDVLLELIENIDDTKLDDFFIKILEKHITGARLWYIYKNECNKDINELIEKDLTLFTDVYFHENENAIHIL
jgi:hypothetical protein